MAEKPWRGNRKSEKWKCLSIIFRDFPRVFYENLFLAYECCCGPSSCADHDIISACAFVWFSVATDKNNFPMSHSAYAPIMKKCFSHRFSPDEWTFAKWKRVRCVKNIKSIFFSFRGRFIYTIDPLPEVSARGKCENCVKITSDQWQTHTSHWSHKSLSHWWRHQIWFICVQAECLRYSWNGFGI